MTTHQARVLNEVVIPMLMRAGDEDSATQMMLLALEHKFKPEPRPSNVVDFRPREFNVKV